MRKDVQRRVRQTNYFRSEIQAVGVDFRVVSVQLITETTGAEEGSQGNLYIKTRRTPGTEPEKYDVFTNEEKRILQKKLLGRRKTGRGRKRRAFEEGCHGHKC